MLYCFQRVFDISQDHVKEIRSPRVKSEYFAGREIVMLEDATSCDCTREYRQVCRIYLLNILTNEQMPSRRD